MIVNKIKIVVVSLTVIVSLVAIATTSVIGGVESRSSARPAPTPDQPPYSEYKGVILGMAADEARLKLGVPKDKSDAQDYFEFSANESAQVYYDDAHKVTAITVTYTGKLDAAPTAKAVFGEDVEAKPDGGIFKMVRYPKAGFWISYNKTGGDDPLVMIAMQKM